MQTIYAVVEKESKKVIGFHVNKTFPKNGNDAILANTNYNYDTDEMTVNSLVNVFFSTAKGYTDQLDVIPTKSVQENWRDIEADYTLIQGE